MKAGEPDAATIFFRQRLAKVVHEELSPHLAMWRQGDSATKLCVLDVGCGHGHWLEHFRHHFVPFDALFGIDRNEERLRKARASSVPAHPILADASHLPFADSVFDLVMQFVMMTSVLAAEERRWIAREMLRVLKPGGLLLWYDFFAPNVRNRRTRAIGFTELRTLFPGCRLKMRKVTLAPPLARLCLPRWQSAAETLERVPWLRTHYLALIEPGCAA